MTFSVQVANRGTADLLLGVVADCGCVHVSIPEKVAPGQSGLVSVSVDTTALSGEFHKGFVLYTNDPSLPDKRIEIKAKILPIYRFLRPTNEAAIVVDKSGAKQVVYLAVNQNKPFKITAARLLGVNGIVDYEPWEGKMADPSMGE